MLSSSTVKMRLAFGGMAGAEPRSPEPAASLEPLAEGLERCARSGDWRSTGIVWPRVAEISLLAALGCGDWLVSVVLEELVAPIRDVGISRSVHGARRLALRGPSAGHADGHSLTCAGAAALL